MLPNKKTKYSLIIVNSYKSYSVIVNFYLLGYEQMMNEMLDYRSNPSTTLLQKESCDTP